MEGGEKVSLCRFGADQKIASSSRKRKRKKDLGASYSTSNKLLLVDRHINSDYGPPKMPLKLAV